MATRVTVLFLLLLSLFISIDEIRAGRLYARRPRTSSPVYNLEITAIRTMVSIDGLMATTHVDEEFYNGNDVTLEGFYAFVLPEGARVHGLWLWEDSTRLEFEIRTIEEAEREYDSAIANNGAPAILKSLGANRFEFRIYPIKARSHCRIELVYFQSLPLTTDGMIHYWYPLNNEGYQSQPVKLTEMKVHIRSSYPIQSLVTSFDDKPLMNRITWAGNREASIDFGIENVNYTQDYELSLHAEGIMEDFPNATYQNPDSLQEDPYFMVWIPPLKPDTATVSTGCDYLFVLDASGSMGNGKIAGVKVAMEKILYSLRPVDRFRLVYFDSKAWGYPVGDILLQATESEIQRAVQDMNSNYRAGGTTHYEKALEVAFATEMRKDTEKRMIFLTDGYPNGSLTSYLQLKDYIEQIDRYGVRLFPVLLYTPQIQVLYDLAQERWGMVTQIDTGDDIATVIGRLLFELKQGAILQPEVTITGAGVYEVYPLSFPPIVSESGIVVAGRFRDNESAEITFTSRDTENSLRSITRQAMFTRDTTSTEAVARYWASQKINHLLSEIRHRGELPELKEAVIALSLKYQILTRYTAFLIIKWDDPPVISDVEKTRQVPRVVTLHAGYPNPFSPSAGQIATIELELAERRMVSLVVYDLLGRVLRVLNEGMLSPGRYHFRWDGRDNSGNLLPPGVYFIGLRMADGTQVKRIAITR